MTFLKQVRLKGVSHEEAWVPCNTLIQGAVGEASELGKEVASAVSILGFMLLDLNKAIWDHDAPVRMMDVNYGDETQLAKIGLLACDARDFNEFRTRTVDLINLLCGDERQRPVGMNQNRFGGGDGEAGKRCSA